MKQAAPVDVHPQTRARASGCCAAEARADLARLRELESAAREFCDRCERGEIRSERSYRRFRAALSGRATPRG